MSRIGKTPISIPKEVEVKQENDKIIITNFDSTRELADTKFLKVFIGDKCTYESDKVVNCRANNTVEKLASFLYLETYQYTSKIDKELAQNLLIDFKPLLIESYKNIGFRKLSSGLNTLGKLNIDYAQSLLRELSIEDLKNRIDNILNNENNINGALGEIRKVDEKIWKTLYEYANA